MTDDCEVLAAAVLHDTVEDTDATAEEIEQRFGPRVAALVASETEDKHPEMPPEESWLTRKERSLKKLAGADDPGVRILWLSDKLSNIRSLYLARKERGEDMWQFFNQKDPAMHAWYYRSIEALLADMDGYDAMKEYRRLVGALFTEE